MATPASKDNLADSSTGQNGREDTPTKRRPGRPKGSRNKRTLMKLNLETVEADPISIPTPVMAQMAVPETTQPALDQAPKRRPGRPKGSKNKKATDVDVIGLANPSRRSPSPAVLTAPMMAPQLQPPAAPARPQPSSPPRQQQREQPAQPPPQKTIDLASPSESEPEKSAVPKRGRGRPKGSGKKQTAATGPSRPQSRRISASSRVAHLDTSSRRAGRAIAGSTAESSPAEPEPDPDPLAQVPFSGMKMTDTDSHMVDVDSPAEPAAGKRVGRPKGGRPPKQEADQLANLPPHEAYFFSSRPGTTKTSANTFPTSRLAGPDETKEWTSQLYAAQPDGSAVPTTGHRDEVESLNCLQTSMFGQWVAEFEAGFNICVYGYGSKRHVTRQFARAIRLAVPESSHPILIVEGFSADFSLKDVLVEMCKLVVPPDMAVPATVPALKDMIADGLSATCAWADRMKMPQMVVLIINSIDSIPMRTARIQSYLADIASLPRIAILATADTANFQLMWDAHTRERFHFLFHDCTTYASFHAEADIARTLEYTLGWKNRRTGGIGGVEFVLKSLPANARRLFVLLINEQLAAVRLMSGRSGGPDGIDEDENEDENDGLDAPAGEDAGTGVEYHVLYSKMSEELICTSIHQFHLLLKEFVDHELIELSRDGTGATRLRVPFRRSGLVMLLDQIADE